MLLSAFDEETGNSQLEIKLSYLDQLGQEPSEALRMGGTGLAIGLAGALAVGKFLRSQSNDLGPTDPVIFGFVSVIIGLALVAAAYFSGCPGYPDRSVIALRQE